MVPRKHHQSHLCKLNLIKFYFFCLRSIRDDPPEERIQNVGHIMDHLEVKN